MIHLLCPPTKLNGNRWVKKTPKNQTNKKTTLRKPQRPSHEPCCSPYLKATKGKEGESKSLLWFLSLHLVSIIKSILTVSAGIIFTKGGNYKEKTSALINILFGRTQQHKLKWLILQSMSSEPQRVRDREAHSSAVQPWKPSDCPGRDAICTSLSGQSWHCGISACLRQIKKSDALLYSYESKTWQEYEELGFLGVETIILAGAEDLLVTKQYLALLSRWGQTCSPRPATLQMITHDGRGGIFNLKRAVAEPMYAGLESPTLQPSRAWAAASQGSLVGLRLCQHNVVSLGLALLLVWGVLFGGEGKRQGEKSFCGSKKKPEMKRIQTRRQSTLQSLPLTVLKLSDGLKSPNSDFSEHPSASPPVPSQCIHPTPHPSCPAPAALVSELPIVLPVPWSLQTCTSPITARPMAACTKPMDQPSATSLFTRCLLSLPRSVRPCFLGLR